MEPKPQPLTASDVEKLFSTDFRERAFASLCNDLVWASAGRDMPSLPSFTERTSSKDRGIDASWSVDDGSDAGHGTDLLIGSGWNVYQYKQRDASSDRGRNAVISNLCVSFRGELQRLWEETGRRPTRYVFFTNLDLLHGQKEQQIDPISKEGVAATPLKGAKRRSQKTTSRHPQALREAILDGYDDPDGVQVSILGAAELKVLLNAHPHIRAAYFGQSRYVLWERAWTRHSAENPSYRSEAAQLIPLVGHDDSLAQLEAAIDDPAVRVVIVTGVQGVGKSRLALEATRNRMTSTLFALDSDVAPHNLREIATPNTEVLVVIDDPSQESTDALVHSAITSAQENKTTEGLKVIITLPVRQGSAGPNYGLDERVQYIRVTQLSETDSNNLLRQADKGLDYGTYNWIVHQAGGIPRVLLLAAQFGPELRHSAANFVDTIASAMETRILRRQGQSSIDALQILSLLSRTGVRGTGVHELKTVCSLFGGDANSVLRALPNLEQAGLVRVGGDSVEVSPPLLAARLASEALKARLNQLLALFALLHARGRARLIARLATLNEEASEVATQFRTMLFEKSRPLGSLQQALNNLGMLRDMADAEPERVTKMVRHGIESMTNAELFDGIEGRQRSSLNDILVQTLGYRESATDSLWCLALLAAAENETVYSNNSSQLFANAFQWWRPQVALSLYTRLDVLKEIMSSSTSGAALRTVCLRAMETALNHDRMFALHSNRGPKPLETKSPMTWAEVFDYSEEIVGLLERSAEADTDPEVRAAASNLLSECLSGYITWARPEDVLRRFSRLVNEILNGKITISVAKLDDALDAALSEWRDNIANEVPQIAQRYQSATEQVQGLLNRLDNGPFLVRLRVWTSGWQRRGNAEVSAETDGSYRLLDDVMIESLADELITNSALLDDQALDWLGSRDATRSGNLLFIVGKRDHQLNCWPKLSAVAGTDLGTAPVASYLQGVSQWNSDFVRESIVDRFKNGSLTPVAFLFALRDVQADAETAALSASIVSNGLVNPHKAADALLVGEWSDTVSPDDCTLFLRAIAGPGLANGNVVVHYLVMWLHKKRIVVGDLEQLAWECLETSGPRDDNRAYHFDRLAADLAPAATGRAFLLFESLCKGENDDSNADGRWKWRPLDRYSGGGNFWKALREIDSAKFVRSLLDMIRLEQYSPLWLHLGRTEEPINQEEDADVLIAYLSESEKHAGAVCDVVSLRKPGFWRLAFELIGKYPESENVRRVLTARIFQMDRHFEQWDEEESPENAVDEVERLLIDLRTPEHGRRWLRRVAGELKSKAASDHNAKSGSTWDLWSEQDADTTEGGDVNNKDVDWVADELTRLIGQEEADRMLRDGRD